MLGQLGPRSANDGDTLHQQRAQKTAIYIAEISKYGHVGITMARQLTKFVLKNTSDMWDLGIAAGHQPSKNALKKQSNCAIWDSRVVGQNQQMPNKNKHEMLLQN